MAPSVLLPLLLLALLPVRCLRALLDDRCIPHADCVEKEDLARRIELSPKGAVFALPPRVLKQMLRDAGLVAESETHVDKEELALLGPSDGTEYSRGAAAGYYIGVYVFTMAFKGL